MSKLLINEHPLEVLPGLATAIGLNEAIMLQQIHYWIIHPKAQERDGRKWHYDTYEAWQGQFPFWSIPTIKRTAQNLEKINLVVSKQFGKLKGDKTKWYSINYINLEKMELKIEKQVKHLKTNKKTTPSDQSDPMPPPMGSNRSDDGIKLIPCIRTETTPETTSHKQQQLHTLGMKENSAMDAVAFLVKELNNCGVMNELDIQKMIRWFGVEQVIKKLKLLKIRQSKPGATSVINPTSWIFGALHHNYSDISEKTEPKRETSQEYVERMNKQYAKDIQEKRIRKANLIYSNEIKAIAIQSVQNMRIGKQKVTNTVLPTPSNILNPLLDKILRRLG